MGYQHGCLLAKFGFDSISHIYYQCGGWSPESGAPPTPEQLEMGRAFLTHVSRTYYLKPFMEQAPEFVEELEGLAAGFQQAGLGVSFDDLFNWVSIFELGGQPGLIARLIDGFEPGRKPQSPENLHRHRGLGKGHA